MDGSANFLARTSGCFWRTYVPANWPRRRVPWEGIIVFFLISECSKRFKHHLFLLYLALGDLAKVKIFPSLYSLVAQHRLPENYFIVGYAKWKNRRRVPSEFRKSIEKHCKTIPQNCILRRNNRKLLSHVLYFSGQYTGRRFERYFDFLEKYQQKKIMRFPKRILPIFLFPISFSADFAKYRLAASKIARRWYSCCSRKPFGEDQASAEQLFHFISMILRWETNFLLDHYLGKTAVQSILTLRHHNSVLNLLLEGKNIAEHSNCPMKRWCGRSNGYFDNVGPIKDMFQSHITQLSPWLRCLFPSKQMEKSFHRENSQFWQSTRFHS